MWGKDGRNNFPLVPPVDPEIVLIHRDHGVTGIQFAHTNQTQVGQVGFTIFVAAGEIA
jgi:hypothetical protein